MSLDTARLHLRPPVAGDADWIAAGISLDAVQRFLTSPPHPYRRADAVAFLAKVADHPHYHVIEAAGRPLGIVSIDTGRDGEGELGYWIHPDGWGRGLMTEAASAALDAWFAAGHDRAVSGYITDNPRSARVLDKLGFVPGRLEHRRCNYRGLNTPVRRMHLDAALRPVATSARLTYRPLAATDEEALHALVSDWEVVRQLGSWPWPPDRAVTRSRARPFGGNGFVWGICREGRLIGTIGITDGDLGYTLAPAEWGRGLAGEAAQRALAEAAERGLAEVTAACWADNTRSRALLQRLGFTETGRHRERALARGMETDSVSYRLTLPGSLILPQIPRG